MILKREQDWPRLITVAILLLAGAVLLCIAAFSDAAVATSASENASAMAKLFAGMTGR